MLMLSLKPSRRLDTTSGLFYLKLEYNSNTTIPTPGVGMSLTQSLRAIYNDLTPILPYYIIWE